MISGGGLLSCVNEVFILFIHFFRTYGFHSFLSDLFEAPPPVMRVLKQMYNVHGIPVGEKSTNTKVEQILRHTPSIQKFYTDDFSVNLSLLILSDLS
jgi:hypothetical protein